jgi:hypothetical protein
MMEYDKRLGRNELNLVNNMKELLDYWREYYRASDRDCRNLEVSAKIPYTEWAETANVVTELVESLK